MRGNLVYATAGYGAGCDLLEISGKGDKFEAKQLYDKNKQDLAKLFGRTAPAIDTFISNNPLLIKNEGNGWRFTL